MIPYGSNINSGANYLKTQHGYGVVKKSRKKKWKIFKIIIIYMSISSYSLEINNIHNS